MGKKGDEIVRNTFRSISDPIEDLIGAGIKSHPVRWNAIMNELIGEGVQVTILNTKEYAFAPGLRTGEPGQIKIYKYASISALEHEYEHFLFDKEHGYMGMRSVFDIHIRARSELRAYTKEVEFVRNNLNSNPSAIDQLIKNFIQELEDIQNEDNKITDNNLLTDINSFIKNHLK